MKEEKFVWLPGDIDVTKPAKEDGKEHKPPESSDGNDQGDSKEDDQS